MIVVIVVVLLFLLFVVLVGEEAFGFESDIDGLAVLVIYTVVDFFFHSAPQF